MHTVKRSRNCFFIELRWYDKDRLSDGEIKYINAGQEKIRRSILEPFIR